MDKDLLKILRELRGIKPDPDYARQSRFLILSSEEKPMAREAARAVIARKFNPILNFINAVQSIKFAMAAEIISILVIAVLVGAYAVHQGNKSNLVVQADELNSSIQLKLNEIQYLLKNQAQTSALNIADVASPIDTAADDLNQASALIKNNEIENAIVKIKEAEKIFQDIETNLKK